MDPPQIPLGDISRKTGVAFALASECGIPPLSRLQSRRWAKRGKRVDGVEVSLLIIKVLFSPAVQMWRWRRGMKRRRDR